MRLCLDDPGRGLGLGLVWGAGTERQEYVGARFRSPGSLVAKVEMGMEFSPGNLFFENPTGKWRSAKGGRGEEPRGALPGAGDSGQATTLVLTRVRVRVSTSLSSTSSSQLVFKRDKDQVGTVSLLYSTVQYVVL